MRLAYLSSDANQITCPRVTPGNANNTNLITRVTSHQPAGRLLSSACHLHANHAATSTSTIRCATAQLLVTAAMRSNMLRKLLSFEQTVLALLLLECFSIPSSSQTMPSAWIKPNLVDRCIQKRFDVAFDSCSHRVFFQLELLLLCLIS